MGLALSDVYLSAGDESWAQGKCAEAASGQFACHSQWLKGTTLCPLLLPPANQKTMHGVDGREAKQHMQGPIGAPAYAQVSLCEEKAVWPLKSWPARLGLPSEWTHRVKPRRGKNCRHADGIDPRRSFSATSTASPSGAVEFLYGLAISR